MIVVPSRTSSRNMSQSSFRLRGSRPVVGSSRNSTAGDHEARREVEPAAHAAREGLHELGRRVGEVELLEQLVGARAHGLREVVQAADHHEVRRALINPSTVACCAATPMRSRTRSGSVVTSKPATRALPSVGAESVVRMRIAVVLPGAVVAEQAEHGARRHVEVEVAQRPQVAEALAEARGDDAALGSRVGREVRWKMYACSYIVRPR